MGKADRARGSASSEHGPLIHHPATELLELFFFFFFPSVSPVQSAVIQSLLIRAVEMSNK